MLEFNRCFPLVHNLSLIIHRNLRTLNLRHNRYESKNNVMWPFKQNSLKYKRCFPVIWCYWQSSFDSASYSQSMQAENYFIGVFNVRKLYTVYYYLSTIIKIVPKSGNIICSSLPIRVSKNINQYSVYNILFAVMNT